MPSRFLCLLAGGGEPLPYAQTHRREPRLDILCISEQRERCLLRWEKVSRDATDEVAPYGSSVAPNSAVILEGGQRPTEGSEAAQRITISVASNASVAFPGGKRSA